MLTPAKGDGKCCKCDRIIPAHETMFEASSEHKFGASRFRAWCFDCAPNNIAIERSLFGREKGKAILTKWDVQTQFRDNVLYTSLAEGYINKIWKHVRKLDRYSDVRSVARESTASGPAIVCEGKAASIVVAVSTDVHDPLTIYCREYYYKPPKGKPGLFTDPDAQWSIKNPHGVRRAIEFTYRVLEPRNLSGKLIVPRFKKTTSNRKYGKRSRQKRRK